MVEPRTLRSIFRITRGIGVAILGVLLLSIVYAAWMGIRNWHAMGVV